MFLCLVSMTVTVTCHHVSFKNNNKWYFAFNLIIFCDLGTKWEEKSSWWWWEWMQGLKGSIVQLWLFSDCFFMRYPLLDASVGDSFVADPSWAAFGSSGFEHDDYGLRMAGGRERNSKSTTMILYAVQTINRTEPQNWPVWLFTVCHECPGASEESIGAVLWGVSETGSAPNSYPCGHSPC